MYFAANIYFFCIFVNAKQDNTQYVRLGKFVPDHLSTHFFSDDLTMIIAVIAMQITPHKSVPY